VITFVIFASGLKYVGVGTTTLGWILVLTLLAAFVAWLVIKRPWETPPRLTGLEAADATPHPEPE
jgi:hypothetical protein